MCALNIAKGTLRGDYTCSMQSPSEIVMSVIIKIKCDETRFFFLKT